jgi:hypothetical protein
MSRWNTRPRGETQDDSPGMAESGCLQLSSHFLSLLVPSAQDEQYIYGEIIQPIYRETPERPM